MSRNFYKQGSMLQIGAAILNRFTARNAANKAFRVGQFKERQRVSLRVLA